MRPVFESYSQSVSASNGVDLNKSVMDWVHDYLSLIALRPGRYTVCLQSKKKIAWYGHNSMVVTHIHHNTAFPSHKRMNVNTHFQIYLTKVSFCVFRSTLTQSWTNKASLKCPSVRPSTKSFFDFNEIWHEVEVDEWCITVCSITRSKSSSLPFTIAAGSWPLILKLEHKI